MLDRAEFLALLDQAVRVAEPLSAPLLFLIDLAGLQDIGASHGPEVQARLAAAAAGRVAEALGDNGYACALRGSRLAVLAASDSRYSADAIGNALLASLARPVIAEGLTLVPGAALGMARWGIDGERADELFVAADVGIQGVAPVKSPSHIRSYEELPVARVRFIPSPLRLTA